MWLIQWLPILSFFFECHSHGGVCDFIISLLVWSYFDILRATEVSFCHFVVRRNARNHSPVFLGSVFNLYLLGVVLPDDGFEPKFFGLLEWLRDCSTHQSQQQRFAILYFALHFFKFYVIVYLFRSKIYFEEEVLVGRDLSVHRLDLEVFLIASRLPCKPPGHIS